MKKVIIIITIILIFLIFISCQKNIQGLSNSTEETQNISNASNLHDNSTTERSEVSFNVINNYGDENVYAIPVSIINLIATPEKYDGKEIRVVGIGCIEFEGNAIYLSTEDWKIGNYKNAIWLAWDYEQFEKIEVELIKLNGKPVVIEGIFVKNNNGHFNMFSGSIKEINRYGEW